MVSHSRVSGTLFGRATPSTVVRADGLLGLVRRRVMGAAEIALPGLTVTSRRLVVTKPSALTSDGPIPGGHLRQYVAALAIGPNRVPIGCLAANVAQATLC